MSSSALNKTKAYVIGVALGDGNLSNPNGRAVRLRITCDKKYPLLLTEISQKIKLLLPKNKISLIDRGSCVDVACYSNSLETLLGWNVGQGSKMKQKVRIPAWIFKNKTYLKECLRGLFQTDGSIYYDRGYKMVNFTSAIPELVQDLRTGIESLGYPASERKVVEGDRIKYVIRISKNVDAFIKTIKLWKA